MIENRSGLEPLGRAVLIKMVEASEHKGMIQIPDHVKASAAVMEQRAVVIAIGGCAWEDEPRPRAAIGDRVIVTKLAGYVTKGRDGELYRLVNDRDIFCRVTGEDNG